MYEIVIITNKGEYEHKVLSTHQLLIFLSKRDIKIIDEKQNFRISTLIPENKFILAKFDYLRTIIFQDHAIIFKSQNNIASKQIRTFINNICIRIKSETDDFVLMMLDSILKNIDDYYDNLVEEIKPEVFEINNIINEGKNIKANLRIKLTQIQTKFINLRYRVKDIKELLQEIKDWNEIEVYSFNLTQKEELNDKYVALIDSYYKYYEENLDELDKLEETIEFMIKIRDTNILMTRNKIAKFDINLQIISISITFANLISSSLGMNLKNHFENNNYSFYIANIVMLIFIMSIFISTKYVAHRYIN